MRTCYRLPRRLGGLGLLEILLLLLDLLLDAWDRLVSQLGPRLNRPEHAHELGRRGGEFELKLLGS